MCCRSGIIGERLPIRLYLTAGMLASGLFTCLFGLGYVYNIHSLSFYVVVQVGPVAAPRRREPASSPLLRLLFLFRTGGERPGPNHRLAQRRHLHRKLVRQRTVGRRRRRLHN